MKPVLHALRLVLGNQSEVSAAADLIGSDGWKLIGHGLPASRAGQACLNEVVTRSCTVTQLTSPRSRLIHFLFWALIFSALLLITRLGNLGQEVINQNDRDEGTFIIIASHLRVGHLPYLELFDNKPPGIFFALAGMMSLLGENLITVRFFGALGLLVAALACYGIAVRRNSSLAAGVSTAVFLVLASVPDFQATKTEHLVIALLLPACWLLVARRDRLWSAFTIGVLLSLATLTRTNIAFVVLALGGFYAWQLWQPSKNVPRLALFAYGAGGLMPLLMLLIIYAYADGLDDFSWVSS